VGGVELIPATQLNCPRCGFSIKLRASWLTVEHCPRCIARSGIAVRLFALPLPISGLDAAGAEPDTESLDAARAHPADAEVVTRRART
jgi:hypothetical protein